MKLKLRRNQIAKEISHPKSTLQPERHELKIQNFVNQMAPKEIKILNSSNTSQMRLMRTTRVTRALRKNMVLKKLFEGWGKCSK